MKIFENINNGILPEKKTIIELLNNNYKDEKNSEEIEKLLGVLENAYNKNSSIEEKILINEVIFTLNLISKSKKDAIYNYLDRFLILNMDETELLELEIEKKLDDKRDFVKFTTFFKQLVENFDVDIIMEYINNRLLTLDKLNKEELRSFFNWIAHKIWNTPSFFNNSKFLSLYDNLKSLLYKLIEQNRTDEVMYLEFFIYFMMGNSYQKQEEWKKFNEEISKVCANFYLRYKEKHNFETPTPIKKDKIRIVLLVDRLVNNSPFMVEYSLLKALQENKEFTAKYEIAVYSMNYFEKSIEDNKVIKKLSSIKIPVISPTASFIHDAYYNNHLKKALKMRETIIKDQIDIIIGVAGGHDIMGFLFATRCAPIQIYWSHGNCSYDVPGIDKRISHFEQDCKEFEWNIFNVPMAEEFLIGTEENKIEGKKIKKSLLEKFGKDTIILGTIGRLVKIDSDEYLKTISEILKQNPNTIYLACGIGNNENIEKKLEKYNIDKERFIFTDFVNPHVYGWVIDIWPDTFPLREGQSKNEYTAKGGVVVYMNQYLNDTIRNYYKDFDIKPYANSVEEYLKMVNEFINNLEKREKLSNFNKTIFDNKSVDKFLDILN